MPTGQVFKMADAHHDAARGDQGTGRKPKFLRAQQGADDDIAAGLQLAIGLHDHTAAQAVEDQRLLRLGDAQLPGKAGIFNARQGRCAGAAAIAGDQDVVGLGLGDAGGDCAHAHFAYQLHADAGGGIGILQVVNELRQVLDRINVVVRRRRDQPDARRGVPNLADVLIHLVAGQLAALAGLGALRHLDLQFVGVGQIFGGNAKTGAGHLLDRAAIGASRRKVRP